MYIMYINSVTTNISVETIVGEFIILQREQTTQRGNQLSTIVPKECIVTWLEALIYNL